MKWWKWWESCWILCWFLLSRRRIFLFNRSTTCSLSSPGWTEFQHQVETLPNSTWFSKLCECIRSNMKIDHTFYKKALAKALFLNAHVFCSVWSMSVHPLSENNKLLENKATGGIFVLIKTKKALKLSSSMKASVVSFFCF